MKAIAVVAAIMLCGSLYFQQMELRSQTVLLHNAELEISRLNANPVVTQPIITKPVAASLELQEKCANQTIKAFAAAKAKDNDPRFTGERVQYTSDDHVSHFNPTLNKCFMDLEQTGNIGGHTWTYRFVTDAYEGKIYGNYAAIHTELKPVDCRVVDFSGEEVSCNSREQFEMMLRPYLE